MEWSLKSRALKYIREKSLSFCLKTEVFHLALHIFHWSAFDVLLKLQ